MELLGLDAEDVIQVICMGLDKQDKPWSELSQRSYTRVVVVQKEIMNPQEKDCPGEISKKNKKKKKKPREILISEIVIGQNSLKKVNRRA